MAKNDSEIEPASTTQPATRQADVVSERRESLTITRTWQGPLPDPESLAQYEQLVPGAAERFLFMVEGQVAHRHRMESENSTRLNWGLVAAFVVVVLVVAAGAGLIYLGYGWAGAAVIGINVVGLAAVFITGGIRRRQRPLGGPDGYDGPMPD
jgi:uncharacterized membrane protein